MNTMLRNAVVLCLLYAALAEAATSAPTSKPIIRSRGAKRAFSVSGSAPRTTRSRPSPSPGVFSPSPTPSSTPSPTSYASPARPVASSSPAPLVLGGPGSEAVEARAVSISTFAPHQASYTPQPLSFAPQPKGFTPKAQSFSPVAQGFTPEPHGFSPDAPSFSSEAQDFSPPPQQPRGFARARQVVPSAPTPFALRSAPVRPQRVKPAVPIVALKFNLREDGSYTTSSETGDGTIRQERGDFSGAGMAVQGMYAYMDSNQGPVQVNYVADEFGFQPQGPNIHPAIMQAVAEQVKQARSAKSRTDASALNGVHDQNDEDYNDISNPTSRPKPTVRRVVVRRL